MNSSTPACRALTCWALSWTRSMVGALQNARLPDFPSCFLGLHHITLVVSFGTFTGVLFYGRFELMTRPDDFVLDDKLGAAHGCVRAFSPLLWAGRCALFEAISEDAHSRHMVCSDWPALIWKGGALRHTMNDMMTMEAAVLDEHTAPIWCFVAPVAVELPVASGVLLRCGEAAPCACSAARSELPLR